MRRSRKLAARRAEEYVDALAAIAALYSFIVEELDPDPHPIDAYLTEPRLQRQARLALRLDAVKRERTWERPESGDAGS